MYSRSSRRLECTSASSTNNNEVRHKQETETDSRDDFINHGIQPQNNLNHGYPKLMLEVTDPATLKSSKLSDSLWSPLSCFPSFASFPLPHLCPSTPSKERLTSLFSCIYIHITYYHEVHFGCRGAGVRGIGPGFCAPCVALGRACEVSTSHGKGRNAQGRDL